MKSDDLPPPMPTHADDDATQVARRPARDVSETLHDDGEDVPGLSGTGAKVNLRAIEESTSAPSLPNRSITQSNMERRIPVAARNRPTLMPAGYDEPPKLPTAPRMPNPSLVRPVRPAPELSRVPVGKLPRESSDVIQMFASAGSSPSVPSPLQARRATVPPPPPPSSGKLLRRAPHPAPSAHPQGLAGPAAPSVLPLQPDRMAWLIAEHRGRLHSLDQMARGLEIGAGVLGMLAIIALATTFAAMVSGHSPGVLATATACIGCATGFGASGLLVALSVGLRHQAHTGAQVAALLEALSAQRL